MNIKKTILYPLLLSTVFVLIFLYSIQPEKYNIILIVSDSLRADVLRCYGGKANTPNIDWLAKRGTLFERAYCTSPWTSPSSIGLFTGEYPDIFRKDISKKEMKKLKLKLPSYHVPHNGQLLSHVLNEMDYISVMSSENFLATISNNTQGMRGTKSYEELNSTEKNFIEKITGIRPESDAYKNLYGFLDEILKVQDDKLYYLSHWFMDPHLPYSPIERFEETIDVDSSKLTNRKKFYSNAVFALEKKLINRYDRNYVKNLYLKEVESVDERVGFIIKALKYKNILNNSIIVFTSDHGEYLGEQERWSHGYTYYNTLVQIPLIITGPEIFKDKRVKRTVSLLDLMNTLKGLLGIEERDNSQGESFADTLVKDMSLSRGTDKNGIYFDECNSDVYKDAVVLNNFKLVGLKDKSRELYDLIKDPGENKNISKDNPELVKKLFEKIIKYREENLARKNNILKPDANVKLDRGQVEKLKTLGYIK